MLKHLRALYVTAAVAAVFLAVLAVPGYFYHA